ncbi:MAG: hypothetical protein IPH06_12200 [Alphaproteobacteria bacterium]|jgi:hypothetical protein|nr:hypothetical protein [Alphaproteobacteria bacterium]QQS56234.1 MAG: hypothetical protein IPN28_07955 [Alphaproteobacteria bacterium]
MSFLERLKEQSKIRLLAAVAVVFGLGYALFNQRDAKYYDDVAVEIELAMRICEESREYALEHEHEMLLTKNTLDHIKLDGEEVKLRYVPYPRAMLLHNGFVHQNTQSEYYCSIKDPRGRAGSLSGELKYDYRRQRWVERTWSH